MLLPSAVQSIVVTSVAKRGDLVTCTDFPVAISATYTCDAASKFAMKASCLPSGDQAGLLTVAPFGASSAVDLPVTASIRESPVLPRVVSVRARFALGSTCRPA